MTLSSSSTLVEVEAAYDDNSAYAENNSVAQAKIFAQACRILLRRYVNGVTGADGGGFSRSTTVFQTGLDDAIAFINDNQTDTGNAGGQVIPNFENVRE